MDAYEFLSSQTTRQIDKLFAAARALPEERLNWKPSENSRSAVDMLQEVATALGRFADAWNRRKIEWDQEKFMSWQQERAKLTSLDELEARTRQETEDFLQTIKSIDASQWTEAVEMPFPGEFTVADVLSYHLWNMSYHEGQIYYIGTLDKN